MFLQYLTNVVNSRLTVIWIDLFVRNVYKKLREPYSYAKDTEDKKEHFDNYVPTMCLDIFDKYPKEKYDLILVDEAQDFHKNWYEALCFAKKDEGQIFFFYDPFQEQIQHSMITDLEKAEDIMKFPLKLNFRNTWEITDLLQKLIKKFFPETELLYAKPIENHGKKPELIEIKNWNDQVSQIVSTVEKLVKTGKVIPKNIAIIYDGSMKPPSRQDLSVTTELKKKGFDVISAEKYSEPYLEKSKENSISFDSIRRFKGLEKTVIILTNLKEINKENVKNLYTGLSRARAHLIVISNQKSIGQIKELL
jgi:superfamily I DNA and RNA helicase